MGYSIRFDVTAHDMASRVFREVGRSAEVMAAKIKAADAAMDKSIGSNRAQMWVYGIIAALTALPPALNGAIVLLGGLGSAAIAAGSGLGVLTLAMKGQLSAVQLAIQNNTKLKGNLGTLETAYKAFSHTYRSTLLQNTTATHIWIKGFAALGKAFPQLNGTINVFGHILQRNLLHPLEASVSNGGLAGFLKWVNKVGGADFKSVIGIVKNLGNTVLNLAYDFSGPGEGILKWLDKASAKLVPWSERLGSSSGFHQFLMYTKQNAPLVLGTLGHLAKALVHLAEASAPYSHYMWQALDILAKLLAKLPSSVLFTVAAGMTAINLAAKGAVIIDAFAAAMTLLDVAMDANPIGLVVTAIGLLIVIIEECIVHSSKFRGVLTAAWDAIKSGAMTMVHWFEGPFVSFFTQTIPHAFQTGIRFIVNIWLGMVGTVLNSAAKLFSWVPGIGSKLSKAASEFEAFKERVNKALGGIQNRTVDVTAKANLQQPHGMHFVGRYASGGLINGVGSGRSDSNLAAVSHGEYIMPADVTAKNYTLLEHLRRSGRGFADGGLIAPQADTSHAAAVLVRAAHQFNTSVGDFAKYIKRHLGVAYNHPGGMLAGGNPSLPGYARAYQRFAESLFPGFGWNQSQMPYLVMLWNQESGWNPTAENPKSGAYGIPQALPASKIPGGYHSTPAAQIEWGLNYIKGAYGSPRAAWGHEVSAGWYDQGGIAWGPGWLQKHTQKPERVLSPRQTIAFEALVKHLATQPDANKILKTVADRLDAATKKLDSLLNARAQMAQSIKQGIVASGDITQVGTPADGSRITAYSILAGMRGALHTARQYKNGLAALRKMGLSTALYRQFVSAGVSSEPTVAALLAGGHADVLQANALQASLAGVGTSFGNVASHQLYASRIQPQRQLVHELSVLNRRLDYAVASRRPHPSLSLSSRHHSPHVTIEVHASGVVDPVKVGREIQRALLALKRTNGGKTLGLA